MKAASTVVILPDARDSTRLDFLVQGADLILHSQDTFLPSLVFFWRNVALVHVLSLDREETPDRIASAVRAFLSKTPPIEAVGQVAEAWLSSESPLLLELPRGGTEAVIVTLETRAGAKYYLKKEIERVAGLLIREEDWQRDPLLSGPFDNLFKEERGCGSC